MAERIATSKVAKRLDRYMADENLNYRQLAQKLKVSLSQAHDLATGAHEPRLGTVRRISRRLKIDLAELV